MNGAVRYVVLYRTPERWRFSVGETPEGFACGALRHTPPDAPIEVAQHDLLDHLRRGWNFHGQLTWQQTDPDWWMAEAHHQRQPKIV